MGTKGKNLVVGKRYLVGQRFGRLVVVKESGRDKRNCALWLCKCDCGNEKVVASYLLKRGSVKSCGCLAKEYSIDKYAHSTHGATKTRLYRAWESMIERCNPYNKRNYARYAGRGIKVCEEWVGKHGFEHFRDWAMSHGYDENAPKRQCSLDRIDNDGNYCPENCRWASPCQQAQNRSTTHKVTYYGKEYSIRELSVETGVNYHVLYRRIVKDNIPVDLAVSLPVVKKRGHLREALCERNAGKIEC